MNVSSDFNSDATFTSYHIIPPWDTHESSSLTFHKLKFLPIENETSGKTVLDQFLTLSMNVGLDFTSNVIFTSYHITTPLYFTILSNPTHSLTFRLSETKNPLISKPSTIETNPLYSNIPTLNSTFSTKNQRAITRFREVYNP